MTKLPMPETIRVTVALFLATAVYAQELAPAANSVRIELRDASFRGSDMRRANLADTDLSGSTFLNADVSGASFWRARLDGADFRSAKGFTAQQLTSARWSPDQPPKLPTELDRFRRFWETRRMVGQALPGANWWGADLSGFDFRRADLRGVVGLAASFRGAMLQRADVSGACLAGADLTGADLRGTVGLTIGHLMSAIWDADKPPAVDGLLRGELELWTTKRVSGKQLVDADLWLQDLHGVNFNGANLRGAVLIGADLRGALLRDADLTGAFFTHANISDADFRGSKVSLSRLFSAHWDPDHPPLLPAEADVLRREFQTRRFSGRDLSGANLWSKDLSGGKFVGATLRDVVMIDANLRGTVFRDADLSGANFAGADISRADFRGAKGFGASQLLSARWDPKSPPLLSVELAALGKFWKAKNFVGRSAAGTRFWNVDLSETKLRSADLSGVDFGRSRLRGSDLRLSELQDASFSGTDISGVDFRGAKHLTRKMVLAAIWDPAAPPVFDTKFEALMKFIERRQFEFDLVGVNLNGPDPDGVRGPSRRGDEVASFSFAKPPRLGMGRLKGLIVNRRFGQMRITR